jgi:hypothetical protein
MATPMNDYCAVNGTFRQSRAEAAYHQAGHAVVARWFALPVRGLSIVSQAGSDTGFEHDYPQSFADHLWVEQLVEASLDLTGDRPELVRGHGGRTGSDRLVDLSHAAFDDALRREVEELLVVAWAGVLAPQIQDGTFDDSDNRSVWVTDEEGGERSEGRADELELGEDLVRIVTTAVQVCSGEAYEADAFVEWMRRRTAGLLRREIVWAQVAAVAAALLASDRLGPDELDEIRCSAMDHLMRADHPVFGNVHRGI